MRDPARIDRILGKLRSYWLQVPDQRLGQVYENLRRFDPTSVDPFFWEDDDLEKVLGMLSYPEEQNETKENHRQ